MTNNYLISCSIVCYKNNEEQLLLAIKSFLNPSLNCILFLIDNSPNNKIKNIIQDERVFYYHCPNNPGFGASHNFAIKKSFVLKSKYHLVLNPDIFFDPIILKNITNYLDQNEFVGILMPKILYPDDTLQPLARLLPSPLDFIVRRFVPIKKIKNYIDHNYQLHNYLYNKPLEVPFLSGCFMFFNMKVLEKILGFDENIFMYTEDIDICRRANNAGFKTIVYPYVSVYHDHEKKSFLNLNNFKVYLKSAFYYFNKWGWIFDKERQRLNNRTLKQLIK